MRNEYRFYMDNRNVFLKRHLNKFIVIKGKKFIGSYDTYENALAEGEKLFPAGAFLIQHCTPPQSLDELEQSA